MHVVATAGHVDHGKSTLVRALTGMEPDRWAEERRRGLTIDLGFAWTALPGGEVVAFVDVPGHERFVPTMLAGTGPVPAVLFVVAADKGWRQQSAEHLAALDALGVRHGLLVLSRTDLADPGAAAAAAREQLRATCLRDIGEVRVSAATGEGLDDLRAALRTMLRGLPQADLDDPVRLWVDRSFAVAGAGTVVTGTLAGGTIGRGDRLTIASSGADAPVRGVQALGEPVDRAEPVARVAVNLRGVEHHGVRRGDALLAPAAWLRVDEVDVRVHPAAALERLATTTHLVLHVGTAALPTRLRHLGADVARLRLAAPLPLRIGDRGVLREPSNHQVLLAVTVLDPLPAPLRRRGDAGRRAALLAGVDGRADADSELRRRGVVTRGQLARLGARGPLPAPVVGDWLIAEAAAGALRERLRRLVAQHRVQNPLEPGITTGAAATALDLPDVALVTAVVPPGHRVVGGRVVGGYARAVDLPPAVARGLHQLRADLAGAPFRAPEARRLQELGLGRRELAAAARLGEVLLLGDALVLLPDAPERAGAALAELPEYFTVSQARQAWGTSRRVAVPLLELLDRQRVTARRQDGTRRLCR